MNMTTYAIGTPLENSLLFSSPYDLDLPVPAEDDYLWLESLLVETEEPLYDVYVYPESGEIVQVIQLSSVPRRVRRLRNLLRSTSSTVLTLVDAATPNFVTDHCDNKSTAPGRAFNQVRRRMATRSLTTHARLGYDHPVAMETVKRDISKFATRLRKTHKGMPYVAVPERGELTGALHWHSALPFYIPTEDIERCWIRGSTNVTRMYDIESFERLASYITKTFSQSQFEREFPHRYKKDKRTVIRRELHEGLSQADVEMLVDQMTEHNRESLKFRTPSNKWIAGTYRWQPPHLDEAFLYVAELV